MYPLVIRAGGGSPRDTLSVLDQLLAGADGNQVTYARALALLGATDVALIDDAVDALAAGDAAALFGAVEAVIDAGHDPRRFATDLLERFRDLIVLQSVPDAAARGVVDAPEDVLERMRDQATRIGTATLTRYRRGRARRAGGDARRHGAAAAARGGVRAAAAAVGQRHRIGAAAARRTHRDPARHVDPATGNRSAARAEAVHPQDQGGPARRRPQAKPERRTPAAGAAGACPAPKPEPAPVTKPRRAAPAPAEPKPAPAGTAEPQTRVTPAGESAGGPGRGGAPARGRDG